MSYDLYVELSGNTQKDVAAIVQGNYRSMAIPDIFERIRLLAGVAAQSEDSKLKENVISGDRKQGGGYKSLVHLAESEDTPYAKELIQPACSQIKSLHLIPTNPNLSLLPPGSWFLQFKFTLAKPWISKDDDPFYVAASVNPVRKDKVFKVPFMAASSWKGLLRWTLMHTRLAHPVMASPAGAKPSPERFAQERFVQTLLFGDEQGEEPGQLKGFAEYLNTLKPEARAEYERLLRGHFGVEPKDSLPHHSGRLYFYPTFFDQIDVEVINPHSRKTRAGTNPIYLECVPAGAKGTFSLLYVPFDLIETGPDNMKDEAGKHLRYLAPAIKAMFLTYGFSAKRTSGYGVAEDGICGAIKTRGDEKPLTSLSRLPKEVKDVIF